MAPGESQILDETADLEDDPNDTTTLGGFIADDTTLNDTANQTNWTLGEKTYKNYKKIMIENKLTIPTIIPMPKRMNRI